MKLNTKGKTLRIKKILLDFIPAFLGVLAALLLNNWQQNAKDTAFIHSSIKSIYNDCQKNIAILKEQQKHIECHIDTFRHYANTNSITVFELLKKNNGLHIEMIRNSGWRILEKSPIATNVNYEILTMLNDIDQSTDLNNHLVKTFTNKIYDALESHQYKDMVACQIQLNDLYNSYNNLELSLIKLDSLINKEYRKIIKK